MAGSFLSPDGDLEQIFVSDYSVIDEFAKTGSLWLWGRNKYGGIGNNGATQVGNFYASSPVQTVAGGTNWKQIATCGDSAMVIKTDGTLWTWGRAELGSLGNNSTVHRSSPVQTIAGGTNWLKTSTYGAGDLARAAIKTDGTLWLWGFNTSGQLGDNTIVNKSSPVQSIAAGNTWKQVSQGNYHGGAIKTNGTLWMWGMNTAGQLGDLTQVSKSSPVQTAQGGTNWKQVSCNGFSTNSGSTAAIKTDGTLWMWGMNVNGKLGINSTSPLLVSSPIQTVAGGTNWKLVFAGDYHVGAIKTDGTLWMWGRNSSGELGDNTTTQKNSPIQTVAGGTNWKTVTCGPNNSTIAIKNDGTAWGFGFSGDYQFQQTGATYLFSSPIMIGTGSNWKQIQLGWSGAGGIYFYDAGNLYPSR